MTMEAPGFYENLQVYEDLSCIVNLDRFVDVPQDWYVVIADIVNSSEAIDRGQYRAVNAVGAAVITAMLNAAGRMTIPYVFGGDGATLCIPPSLLMSAKSSLSACIDMADNAFGLNLRVGMVPVSRITTGGLNLRLARCRMSPYLVTAMFIGTGLERAEAIIKHGTEADGCIRVHGSSGGVANFSGLECRWEQVPSRHGETVTLMVKARTDNLREDASVYASVLEAVHVIYGEVPDRHPLHTDGLRLSRDRHKLESEFRIRTHAMDVFRSAAYWLRLQVQNILGRQWLERNFKLPGFDWRRYKSELLANSDYLKLDGVLRMVISGNAGQRHALTTMLDEIEKAGRLVYGLHVADAAQVTCLVFGRQVEHIHFVDGVNGGYTLASSQLKRKLN